MAIEASPGRIDIGSSIGSHHLGSLTGCVELSSWMDPEREGADEFDAWLARFLAIAIACSRWPAASGFQATIN